MLELDQLGARAEAHPPALSPVTEPYFPLAGLERLKARTRMVMSFLDACRGTPAGIEDLLRTYVARARMLVIATPDTLNVRQMIAIARELNPDIQIVVRTHSEEEAGLLEREIEGKVFLGEEELAQSMTRYVLEHSQTAAAARAAA